MNPANSTLNSPWQNLSQILPSPGRKRQSLFAKAKVLLAKVNRREFNKLLSAVIAGPKDLLFTNLKPETPLTVEDGKELLGKFQACLSDKLIDPYISGLIIKDLNDEASDFLDGTYQDLYNLSLSLTENPALKKLVAEGKLDDCFAEIDELREASEKQIMSWYKAFPKLGAQSQASVDVMAWRGDIERKLKASILNGESLLPHPKQFKLKFFIRRAHFRNRIREKDLAKEQAKVEEAEEGEQLKGSEISDLSPQEARQKTNYFYSNNEAWFYAAKYGRPLYQPWLEAKMEKEYK